MAAVGGKREGGDGVTTWVWHFLISYGFAWHNIACQNTYHRYFIVMEVKYLLHYFRPSFLPRLLKLFMGSSITCTKTDHLRQRLDFLLSIA